MREVGTGSINDVRRALSLLPRRDRLLLVGLTGFQTILALADLVAIAALGLVTASAAAIATGTPVSVPSPFGALGTAMSSPRIVLLVAVGAGLLLITRSIVSFLGTRRTFRFLANRQAMISSRLADELLSRPLLHVMSRSTQESALALTRGVSALTVGILGQSVVIVSEASLTLVLLAGLAFIDLWLTLFTALFFGSIAISLYVLLGRWAVRIGRREATADAKGIRQIQEAIRGYREVMVSGRRGVYTARFKELVWEVAQVQADRMMVTTIGKYVFEMALIVGAGLLILSQALQGNLAAAASTIVVFFAAASRIMPALLRLQGALLMLGLERGASHLVDSLLEESGSLDPASIVSAEKLKDLYQQSENGYPGFVGTLDVQDVSLRYPSGVQSALSDVTIHVDEGRSIALVGPSGAGKSSLADVILGVVSPDSGYVRISGRLPDEAIKRWPGVLAYVPQDVAIVDGTVRANVAMGLPEALIDDDRVREALHRAHLTRFLDEYREGLDTLVGEHGIKLSGGQRQRLGLARALYTRPRFLVLDEATSALDAQTEFDISQTVSEMSGEVTRVIVAHRLATIRSSDVVVYLDHGRVIASGTFDEVRIAIPDFDRQAELLGL